MLQRLLHMSSACTKRNKHVFQRSSAITSNINMHCSKIIQLMLLLETTNIAKTDIVLLLQTTIHTRSIVTQNLLLLLPLETTNIAKTDILILLLTTSHTRSFATQNVLLLLLLETNKNAKRSSIISDTSMKHCYINLNSATAKTTIIATKIICYC